MLLSTDRYCTGTPRQLRRVVVKTFRSSPSPFAPGRYHDHGNRTPSPIGPLAECACLGKMSLLTSTVEAPCAANRRRRRHDMIEEPSVFRPYIMTRRVLAEDLLISTQRFQHLGDIPGAVIGRPLPMPEKPFGCTIQDTFCIRCARPRLSNIDRPPPDPMLGPRVPSRRGLTRTGC